MKQIKTILALAMLSTLILAACSTSSASQNDVVVSTVDPNFAKLNLNTVSGDELLASIPNFPNRMVREFQEYRPYVSIQQFRKEIGKYVGDAQVAEYEKYVYVPIAINDSDSETLQQIPGLDSSEADSLIAGRPYASNDEFLAKLGGLVTADELNIASIYLESK